MSASSTWGDLPTWNDLTTWWNPGDVSVSFVDTFDPLAPQ